jgi:hypothetical protein
MWVAFALHASSLCLHHSHLGRFIDFPFSFCRACGAVAAFHDVHRTRSAEYIQTLWRSPAPLSPHSKPLLFAASYFFNTGLTAVLHIYGSDSCERKISLSGRQKSRRSADHMFRILPLPSPLIGGI